MPKVLKKAPFCPPVQLGLFAEDATLARIDPDSNCWRFYRLTLQPDLFGGCAVVRHWGRIGTAGQMRADLYGDRGRAQIALEVILGEKMKRGYQHREGRA